MSSRAAAMAKLTAAIRERDSRRIAIDGRDATGKLLAAELGAVLQYRVLTTDDYLNPKETRYQLGTQSPEGHYMYSYDIPKIRQLVLTSPTPLITEGVFLQRPALKDLWDFRIYVTASESTILDRAIIRDGDKFEDVVSMYQERFLPSNALYLQEVDPVSSADVLFHNEQPQAPHVEFKN